MFVVSFFYRFIFGMFCHLYHTLATLSIYLYYVYIFTHSFDWEIVYSVFCDFFSKFHMFMGWSKWTCYCKADNYVHLNLEKNLR